MTMMAALLFAKITFLEPKAGSAHDFEAGYRRHLDWHRAQGDPWTWHGWTILTGERPGWFVDATFDRTPKELDSPIAPAEDVADNAKNVAPYARFASTAIYRQRTDLCGGTSASVSGKVSSLVAVRVAPGGEARFESALRASKFKGMCLELVSGGSSPSYLLLTPYDALSALVEAPRLPPLADVQSVVSETLRYRPELGYSPE